MWRLPPSDGVRFKESAKGGCTAGVPQQVCSVWLESDDGAEDGWAENLPILVLCYATTANLYLQVRIELFALFCLLGLLIICSPESFHTFHAGLV